MNHYSGIDPYVIPGSLTPAARMGIDGDGGRSIVEPKFSKALVLLVLSALATSVLMAVLASPPARADNYTVTNTNDSGAGSLRQAIIDANASEDVADTIGFAPSLSGKTITVGTSGPPFESLPEITAAGGALTIDGDSANITVREPHVALGPVFMVGKDAKLTLNGLTVTDGATDGAGGGIYNLGTLEVNNSTISDNTANAGGGGIYNAGTLLVRDSTISGNTDYSAKPTLGGGGIFSAAGSTLTLINSTIADNTATTYGGAIRSDAANARVWNTTIYDNFSGDAGAGIFLATHMTLWNTLLAFNQTPTSSGIHWTNCWPYVFVTDGGNNLDSHATCHFGTAHHSFSNTDPFNGRALFADWGGPTNTVNLPPDSPALDAGNNAFAVDPDDAVNPGGDPLRFDQRGEGFARISPVGGTVDIGAFELQQGLGSEPPPTGAPEDKQACKTSGFREFGFKNQGLCIKAVNHPS